MENNETRQQLRSRRIQELSVQYTGNWKFLQYLIGMGFKIYNEYKNHMPTDVYQKLFTFLLDKDGFDAIVNAERPIYWGQEMTDATYTIPFLIDNQVIMDIYAKDTIGNEERMALKTKMKLTHTQYGMIVNFDDDRLYTERYVRDKPTGIIDKL